jgi:aspartate racemase
MKRLGILGGMGPAASAEFVNRLIAQTPASCDQEHIPFVLWSNPQIPDRSTSMRNGDNNPLPFLLEGIRGLKSAGCNLIVIPCNTAHFWFHEFSKVNVRIVHIVDSVASALKDAGVSDGTIGVIGTQATVELGLYQYMLNRQGWNCITPDRSEMDFFVQPAIDLIKSGKILEAEALLMKVIHSLIDRGARAVVLGCTEIPLAIRIDQENGIPLINSIDSLVKVVIKEFDRP